MTRLNHYDIWQLYDLQSEKKRLIAVNYLTNQFIHAYTSIIVRDESRNWSDAFVVSDFDRNKLIWRVPIKEIRRIFKIAAIDYPTGGYWKFDKKIQDYVVLTN